MTGRGTSALVLGGGGITGIAWELGILTGLARGGVDLTGADIVVGTAGLALCLAVVCLALREDVPLQLVGLAAAASAAGWCGAWWVLRCSVTPTTPADAGANAAPLERSRQRPIRRKPRPWAL